jgi:AmmeMemoRadiSam system protein B
MNKIIGFLKAGVKTRINELFTFFIIVSFLFLPYLTAGEIRPVRDDIGFCWKKEQVERLVDYLKSSSQEKAKTGSGQPAFVAGISPHDDYLYAGKVYYPLFKNIKAKEAIIFGVTHSAVRKKIADPENIIILDEYKYWKGPYKNVKVSGLRDFLKKRLDSKRYLVSNEAHRLEHSIEAAIPFLQYFNRDIKITPIMITGMSFRNMVKISVELSAHIVAYIRENNLEIGKDIFFLISADANHYGKDFNNIKFGEDERAHLLGTGSDKKIAGTFLSGKISKTKIAELAGKLWGTTYKEYGDRVWCGKYAIPFGMLTILKTLLSLEPGKSLMGKILIYTDTYSEGVIPLKKPGYGITAPFSLKHWVGLFSAGFYLE